MESTPEFLEKAQAEFLTGLKQAQELNVKAIELVTELFKQNGTSELPTPSQIVERTFAFTNDVLAARKEYMLKLAGLFPKN